MAGHLLVPVVTYCCSSHAPFYQVRAKTKNSPNAFRIRTFLFRCHSSGTETKNTSIHVSSRSSLENHTRFHTKAQNPYLSEMPGFLSGGFPFKSVVRRACLALRLGKCFTCTCLPVLFGGMAQKLF